MGGLLSKSIVDEKTIGEAIRSQRLFNQISQKRLAELSGVSLKTIRGLENGREVKLSSYIHVMKALNLHEYLNIPKFEFSAIYMVDHKKAMPQRIRKSK